LLRRAGIEVISAGLREGPVRASRGVVLVPDTSLDTALERDYDMVILPGGLPGADYLDEDPRIAELLQKLANSGRFTAAICAAPKVLASQGLLEGKKATAYPGILDPKAHPGIDLRNDAVVRDGQVITSRGPGTAMDFALELIEVLSGRETRATVEQGLMRS